MNLRERIAGGLYERYQARVATVREPDFIIGLRAIAEKFDALLSKVKEAEAAPEPAGG